MYSLIISHDSEDNIFVASSKDKLEVIALDYIKNNMSDIVNFGSDIIHSSLSEALKINDFDLATELYSDICSFQDEHVYMKIVPAHMVYDS